LRKNKCKFRKNVIWDCFFRKNDGEYDESSKKIV
jgi:hypothetical protein